MGKICRTIDGTRLACRAGSAWSQQLHCHFTKGWSFFRQKRWQLSAEPPFFWPRKLCRSGARASAPSRSCFFLTLSVPSHRDLPVGAPRRLAFWCPVMVTTLWWCFWLESPVRSCGQFSCFGFRVTPGMFHKICSRHGGIRADPIVYSTTKTITVNFAHLPWFYSQSISTTPSVNIDRCWTKSWIFYRQWQSHMIRTIQISGIGLSQIQRSPCDGFEHRVLIGWWFPKFSMANFIGDSSLFQPSGGGVLGMPQARWRYSGRGHQHHGWELWL